MQSEYPIIEISDLLISDSSRFESGAEEKYGILSQGKIAVLKIDDRPQHMSSIWAEKIAAELAGQIGLPTAKYELCQKVVSNS